MSLASLLLFSNAIFFAFSALAVAASVAVFFLTRASERQKERDLEAYKAHAAAEISNSRVEVEQAKAGAARAAADAAQANKKAADLELQLFQEKALTRDRFQSSDTKIESVAQSIAPRVISNISSIIIGDRGAESIVLITSEANDKESSQLANQISKLFPAGTRIAMSQVIGPGQLNPVASPGVHIYRDDNASDVRLTESLVDILSKNKIKCDYTNVKIEVPIQDPQNKLGRLDPTVVVYVGSKPK